MQKRKSNVLKKDKKALITQVEIKEKQSMEAIREKTFEQMQSKKDNSKYQKKIQLYQHEVKKLESEIEKMKKQMTKILDEKTTFSNSYMEIKQSKDMKRIVRQFEKHRVKGEIEFVEMLKNGFDATYNILTEENTKIKGCLMKLQNEMKSLIDSKTQQIMSINSKHKESILKDINMKLYRLKIIKPAGFKLSLVDSIEDIEGIFMENFERFSKFMDAFINPEQLMQFIDNLNGHPVVQQKIGKVRTLGELEKGIFELYGNPERITAKFGKDFPEGGV